MSARTATDLSIEIGGDHLLRTLAGLSLRPVTSPTRMPLNSTEAPVRRPDTEPSNSIAVEGALAGAADVLEPVDEAEHADDDRQREQSDQRVICVSSPSAQTPTNRYCGCRAVGLQPPRERLPWK